MIVSCNATHATHKLNRNFLKSVPLYVYHLCLAMQVEFYTQSFIRDALNFVREGTADLLERSCRKTLRGLISNDRANGNLNYHVSKEIITKS